MRRQHAKLLSGMSEETDLSLTVFSIFAGFSSVTSWVKPTFKHPVCKLAVVASATSTSPEIRADSPGVMVPPGVPPASLLSGMSEWAFSPVVAPAASAPANLELKHPKMIRGVGVGVGVGVGAVAAVERQELLEEGLGGQSERFRRVGEDVGAFERVGVAAEKLSGGNIDGFLVEELVGEEKLVMVSRNPSHVEEISFT